MSKQTFQPIRDHIEKTFKDVKVQNLRSPATPAGWIQKLQSISWEVNKALGGGNTKVRLYVERQGSKHPLEEQSIPIADELNVYNDPIDLFPGDNLLLELDQTAAATHVKLYWAGYATPVEPA